MLTQLRKFNRDLSRVRKEGPPKVMFWAVINHCNAVCKTCTFYLVPKKERVEVSFEDAKKAISVMKASDFRLVSMTGGEPLMHSRFIDICHEVNRAGIEISYIPTNGILLDEAYAAELAKVKPKVVGISVEQIEADGMGLTRKIKNFRKVLEESRAALERNGVNHYAGAVLTKGTNDIYATLKFVRDLGFTKVAFSYPQLEQHSTYSAARKIEEIDLTVEEVQSQVAQLKQARKDFPDITIFNSDESLDDFARFYTGEPRKYPCWGGKKLFYMDWKCDVYPCFTLGNRYVNLLEVERFDHENAALCDKCTQQGFRELGPVYQGVSAVADSLARPHRLPAYALNGDTRGAISSLIEMYRGGFA